MELAEEIVLLDIKEGFAEGKAMDMNQTANLHGFKSKVHGVTNNYAATAGSKVVVITSGIPRKPGMTREQVRFALGSPTLTSVLHADRWDYPYFFKPGYGKPSERKFTVYFQNDVVARWEGDAQPELQPFQVVEQDATKSAERQRRVEQEAGRERDGAA